MLIVGTVGLFLVGIPAGMVAFIMARKRRVMALRQQPAKSSRHSTLLAESLSIPFSFR